PYIYWLRYLSHFKRDCPELKDNNSAHVIEGSSEYEGYEHGEALVVLVVSEELGRSCVLQGGDHGVYTLAETQFGVESSNSGRQTTLTLGYVIRDWEESGIVEPK
ncbi:hypothetical protein A2U01_0051390, partial [Trifolium medium]|nr:hypothetical protein [Trifolium medium]